MDEMSKQKLASDWKALTSDVEDLLKATASQTGERVAELRQRLEKKLENGRKTLTEQEKALAEKAEEARASAETYIRENPWATVGIAAAFGLVLGLLLRRD